MRKIKALGRVNQETIDHLDSMKELKIVTSYDHQLCCTVTTIPILSSSSSAASSSSDQQMTINDSSSDKEDQGESVKMGKRNNFLKNTCEFSKVKNNENESIEQNDLWQLKTLKHEEVALNRFLDWRYTGQPLFPLPCYITNNNNYADEHRENEKIERQKNNNNMLTFKINDYLDLQKVNSSLMDLRNAYEEQFAENNETKWDICFALRNLLTNFELIQVAIGELHHLTFDVEDTLSVMSGNYDAVESSMQKVLDGLNELSKVMGRVSCSLNASHRDIGIQTPKTNLNAMANERSNHLNFGSLTDLNRRETLFESELSQEKKSHDDDEENNIVWDLSSCTIDNRTCLISGGVAYNEATDDFSSILSVWGTIGDNNYNNKSFFPKKPMNFDDGEGVSSVVTFEDIYRYNYLALGCENGSLRFIDLESTTEHCLGQIIDAHEDDIPSMTLDHRQDKNCMDTRIILISASHDGVVKLWDLNHILSQLCPFSDNTDITPICQITDCHEGGVLCVKKMHSSCYIATSGQDKLIKLWGLHSDDTTLQLEHIQTLSGHTGPVCSLTDYYRHQDKIEEEMGLLISGDYSGTICLWNLNDFRQIGSFSFIGASMICGLTTITCENERTYLVCGGKTIKV